jgi:hypothetical protein
VRRREEDPRSSAAEAATVPKGGLEYAELWRGITAAVTAKQRRCRGDAPLFR